ncbi:hypothetical protein B0H34DRAFT_724892 [Crassisporium funariophilum]|nr:hypothetical protein B0H34DRAFT_724892 [Crassisporium funariophilum]
MSPLLSLAPELTREITDKLNIKDIKELRLTCKHLSESLAAHALRSITVDLSKIEIEKGLWKLQMLATDACAALRETVELNIASLSPGPAEVSKDANGQCVEQPEPEDPDPSSGTAVAEVDMKVLLYDALSSLKSVRSVKWDPGAEDQGWIFTTVMDALRTLPNLRSLHINIDHCKEELRLDKLIGLHAISISGTASKHYEQIMEHLSRMIAGSPQLTSITMASNYGRRATPTKPQCTTKPQSLHHLVKYYPKDTAPLRLRFLSMQTYFVCLDKITMPHLKFLTSLELKNIVYTPESNRMKEERFESTPNDIWSMLAQGASRLEEISVHNQIVPSFLKYLKSYSGLKKLKLRIGRFEDGSDSDQIALQFYGNALDNHTTSLENLDILARFEGSWYFGAHNQALISKCTKIKELHMCVVAWKPQAGASTTEVIRLLIDTVAFCNPRLKSLRISTYYPEYQRYGGHPIQVMMIARQRITEGVENYRAPPSCRQLPNLALSEHHTFEGELGADGRYQYRDTSPLDQDWY